MTTMIVITMIMMTVIITAKIEIVAIIRQMLTQIGR